MNNSNVTMFNPAYKDIERPYAHVDLSKIKSWDIVMSIMEQQALEAKRHMEEQYQSQCEEFMPASLENFEYQAPTFNYPSNGNNIEESDNSSCYSDGMMSSEPSMESDISQSDSDIEIDVDGIEEDSEEEFYIPSMENIPITVLQLESKLREKERKQS
jgi:hypothetical protein